MVRVEPQSVDEERWPTLILEHAESVVGADEVAQALRSSVRELQIRIDYPDSSAAGDFDAPNRLVLIDPEHFWARLSLSGVAGFAESYMAGEWTSPNLSRLIATLVPWISANSDCGQNRTKGHARALPRGRRRRPDATNTELDDGLPGDLCALYSDETMATSGALFASGPRTRGRTEDGTEVVHIEAPSALPRRTDLGDAQRRAADALLDLANVDAGSRALIIPPRWGELPIRAAERGARVRTVTRSTERLAMLGARFAAADVSEAISLSLAGLDSVSGQVDAVVSDEPGVASEVAALRTVVEASAKLLVPGGRLVMQTLVTPERPSDSVVELLAWESAYIAETGPMASIQDLREMIDRQPGLRFRGYVDFTAHYAETARLWSEGFSTRSRDAAALGFDPVYRRMWAFYLASLHARLSEGWVKALQVVAM